MEIDRWNLIEEIFHGALERPISDRRDYILHACGNDAELRLEIESLLANDPNTATALRSVVAADLRMLVGESTTSEIGLRVGPYRLVRELDSGGMGVVYLNRGRESRPGSFAPRRSQNCT